MNSLISKRIIPTLQQSFRRLTTTAAEDVQRTRTMDNKCINKVILMGRTSGEARMVPMGDKGQFTEFYVFTNKLRRNKQDELIKHAYRHKIYVYQPFLGKRCHDLITKGTRIYIEGELNYFRRENYSETKIVADTVIFLSGTNQMEASNQLDVENDEIVQEDLEESKEEEYEAVQK